MPNNMPEKNNQSAGYTYIANNTRTSLVINSFWIFNFFSAIMPMMGVYTLSKYSIALQEQTEAAKQAFLTVAQNYDTASSLVSIIFICCAFIFSFWIYRASANTHALNPQTKMEFSPGWCIGCYFIPILNLYWPYKSMKELWLINVKKENTSIVLGWWITYLILNFTASAVSKLSSHDQLNLYGYILLDGISNIFGIISAIIAIKIVTEINKAQINKAKNH